MTRNVIKSDFQSSKMATIIHNGPKKMFWNGENHIHAIKNETVAICPGCLMELTGLLSILDEYKTSTKILDEYKTSTKILTDCRHYPGGIKMASLKPLLGYIQYLPWDKYTNSS